MTTRNNRRHGATTTLLLGLLLLATNVAEAQTVAGLWGSTQYQVQLTVSGTSAVGTFTCLADPQAPAGKITGLLLREGQAFAADWTREVGGEPLAFRTWLTFRAEGALLDGIRWAEDSPPTSFSLHRAVNGQIPLYPTDDETMGPAQPPSAPAQANTVDLKGPADSALIELLDGYPRSNLRIELIVNYTVPGTILDTVGMNAAPVGAWALTIGTDGRIAMSVYDAGGWHRLTSQPAAANVDHRIRVDHTGSAIVLTVDGEDVRMMLDTPLSGQPVYVGDFPGDAHWPPPVVTKTGMTGRVVLSTFRALPETAEQAPE